MIEKKGIKFMIKRLKTLVTTIVALAAFSTPLALPALVSAQADNNATERPLSCGTSLDLTNVNCDPADPNAESRADRIVKQGINIFSLIVGVVSVVMIIVGGFKYITSGGESSNVTSAKNTILFAVIGLVVVALAQVIVRFVLSKVSTAGS